MAGKSKVTVLKQRLDDLEEPADLEQIAVVVHHEQNHQVHLSFGESPAVDDGAGERPFHRHPVLNLAEKFQSEPGSNGRLHRFALGLRLSPLCAV